MEGALTDNYVETRGVSNYRSVRRAMKRGHISWGGWVYPKRPFNNRANTCTRKGKHSRFVTIQKKRDYERAKARANKI